MAAVLAVGGSGRVAPGENLAVSWSGIDNPGPLNWLGVYPRGGSGQSGRVGWVRTTGASGGSLTFPMPLVSPGSYEVRLYPDDTNELVLAIAGFDVVSPSVPAAPPVVAPVPLPGAPTPPAAGGFDWRSLVKNPLVVGALGLVAAAQLGLIGGRRR
jgi:hypothetical protein